MKKIIFCLTFLIIQVTFSQTSGWIDKGIYKEQNLKIDNLLSMQYSEKGDIFYTLHSNRMVYYWNTSDGKLVDSLNIPDLSATCFFSADRRTISYYLPIAYELTFKFTIEIGIIDLKSKKLITRSILTVPDDINYSRPSYNLGWITFAKSLTLLDYSSQSNKLLCGTNFEYYYADGPLTAKHEYTTACGGICLFEVKSDTLIRINQISLNRSYGFVSGVNSDYISTYTSVRDYGGSSSLRVDNTKCDFTLNKYDYSTKKSSILMSGEYGSYYFYEQGKGSSTGTSGANKPFSWLFLDNNRSLLFMKSSDIYNVFSTISDSLINRFYIKVNNNSERFTKNFLYIVCYLNKKIFIQSTFTNNIPDSLDCPIEPTNLEVHPQESEFIVADKSGRILQYKNVINDVSSQHTGNLAEIIISPNPATDFIEISVPADLNQRFKSLVQDIHVYFAFGEEVPIPNCFESVSSAF